MKKVLVIIVICLLSVYLAGCGALPSKPPVEEGGEESVAEEVPAADEPMVEEPVVEEAPEPEPAEEAEQVVEEANETAVTEELRISGSLKLQSSRALCPHLADRFSCNKYDVSRCEFTTFVGENDFYPDHIKCRSGYDYRGEDPNHKYCFIQECRPLEEYNVVYAYGGTVAYAEYLYNVEKVEGGIMTHYTLHKCGEEYKEFKTSTDCRVYKSELRII
jgi:hypothetical protein